MADDDPRDRYSSIKEEYEQASQERKESNTGKESKDGGESTEVSTSKEGSEDQGGNESSTQSGKQRRSGNIKTERASVQAYIPENEKAELEASLRKIKALCNLADEDEPLKNDFYAAALRHGYTDLASVAEYLGLESTYEEYGDVIES